MEKGTPQSNSSVNSDEISLKITAKGKVLDKPKSNAGRVLFTVLVHLIDNFQCKKSDITWNRLNEVLKL